MCRSAETEVCRQRGLQVSLRGDTIRRVEQGPAIAYVALGANVGDRKQNILDALERLGTSLGVRVLRVSSLLENPAVGGPVGAPAFLNAVAQIETMLEPHQLLGRLLDIERQMGRVRRQKWEPRGIDLDLVLYGDEVIDSADLIVPHPLMHERRFVLEPLAEIAPDVRHPMLQCTIAELLSHLNTR